MPDYNREQPWQVAAGGVPRAGGPQNWREAPPVLPASTTSQAVPLVFLTLGSVAIVASIVWLLLLLTPAKRGGLLVLAAAPRPGAITRLDVPYDPYGWRSAERLHAWAKSVGSEHSLKPVNPDKPGTLDDPEGWMNWLRKNPNLDPIVVYLGVPTGVSPEGEPWLATGREPEADGLPGRITVKAMLDQLEEAAPQSCKIVVIDSGRPTLENGASSTVHNFAKSMKEKLGSVIASRSRLCVIIGSDEQQHGWESADLGMTALAQSLMASLHGAAAPPEMGSFGVDTLFDSLRQHLELWSSTNRPTQQTPLLLPARDHWTDPARQAAFAETKFFRGTQPLLVTPPLAVGLSGKLVARWKQCEELAGRQPPPQAITPATWRQYREWLLRYEQARAADDDVAENLLGAQLDAAADAMTRSAELPLTSLGFSLPLANAVGQPAPTSASLLEALTQSPNLTAAATRGRDALGSTTRVPVELHLAIMLNHAATNQYRQPTETLCPAWQKAIQNRIQMEQTSWGTPTSVTGGTACERIWPLIRTELLTRDAERLALEDRLLVPKSPEQQQQFVASLESLRQKLAELLQRAEVYQSAYQLRDQAFADLPFLSSWLIEAEGLQDTPVAWERLIEAWRRVIELETLLDQPVSRDNLLLSSRNVLTLSMTLLKAVDDVKKSLLDQLANSTADKPMLRWQQLDLVLRVPPPLLSAEKRAQFTQERRELSRKLQEQPGEKRPATPPRSADVQQSRRDQLAALTREAWPREEQSESLHRRSLRLLPITQPEPASLTSWRQWKSLLEGQALRAARDFWANEQGQPYMVNVVARAYLADAQRFAERLPEPERQPGPDAIAATALLEAKPWPGLTLTTAETKDRPTIWTSESEWQFPYEVAAGPVPGELFLTWTVSDPSLVVVREPQLLHPVNSLLSKRLIVQLGPALAGTPPEPRNAEIRAQGYFRGHTEKLSRAVPLRIQRRPDLVRTERDRPAPSLVAVRADREAKAGHVTLLVEPPGDEPANRRKELYEAFREVLAEAPAQSDLKIVAISNAPLTPLHPLPNQEKRTLRDAVAASDNPMTLLERTPAAGKRWLVAALKKALDELPRDDTLPRTVQLVLTSGLAAGTDDDTYVRAMQQELEPWSRANVTFDVLIFQADEADEKLLAKVFAPIEQFETPGRIVRVRDRKELVREMAAALSPRPRLLQNEQLIRNRLQGPEPVFIPPWGLSATRTDRPASELRWRGQLKPGEYEWRWGRAKPKFTLANGDVVTVKVVDAGEESRFERELYYQDVDPVDPRRQDARNEAWLLSVPHFGHTRNANTSFALVATAAVESKKTEILGQPQPTLAWWDITRLGNAGEERIGSPVWWRTDPGQRAPAWRMVVEHNHLVERLTNVSFRLNFWPIVDAEPKHAFPKITVAELREGMSRPLSDGSRLMATLEPMRFLSNPAADPDRLPPAATTATNLCLVVRVTDPRGRIYHVDCRAPWDATVIREHRYYHDPDDKKLRPRVLGYTLVMGPLNPATLDTLGPVTFNVRCVTDAMPDEQNAPMTVMLGSPPAVDSTLRKPVAERGTGNP